LYCIEGVERGRIYEVTIYDKTYHNRITLGVILTSVETNVQIAVLESALRPKHEHVGIGHRDEGTIHGWDSQPSIPTATTATTSTSSKHADGLCCC